MPTIEDLKGAFAARAAHAPSADHLLATLPAHAGGGRRRLVAASGGAVTVAAVAIAAVALAQSDGPAPSPPAPTSAPAAHSPTPPAPDSPPAAALQYHFAVGPVPGYEFSYAYTEQDDQSAMVAVADGGTSTGIGMVIVHKAGKYDPTIAQQGEPVTVSGRPGFYRRLGNGGKSLVAWQYAADSWAEVVGKWPFAIEHGLLTGDDKQLELAVAEAVDTTATAPVLVPLRLGYLPSGLVPQIIGQEPDGSQARIGFTDGDARLANQGSLGDTIEVDAYANRDWPRFQYADAQGQVPNGPDLGAPVTTPQGRAFQSPDGSVTVLYDDRYVVIKYTGSQPPRVSDADLLRIAQGLTISPSMTDVSTWSDAQTLLP